MNKCSFPELSYLGESIDSDIATASTDDFSSESSPTLPIEMTKTSTQKLQTTAVKLLSTTPTSTSTSASTVPTKNLPTLVPTLLVPTLVPTLLNPNTNFNSELTTTRNVTRLNNYSNATVTFSKTTLTPTTATSIKMKINAMQSMNTTTTTQIIPKATRRKLTYKIISKATRMKTMLSTTSKPIMKFPSSTKKIEPFKSSRPYRWSAIQTTAGRPMTMTKAPPPSQQGHPNPTRNAMFLSTSRKSFWWQFVLILFSATLLLCILLTLTLITWKRYGTNKWNQYNSHQIKYKSNCHLGGAEESLIRSDSFIIDDSFDAKLIDGSNGMHADGNEQHGGKKKDSRTKSTAMNKINTATDATNKIRKVSDRSKKICDQYSEKRCLTSDIIDDEQLDFTIRTNI